MIGESELSSARFKYVKHSMSNMWTSATRLVHGGIILEREEFKAD